MDSPNKYSYNDWWNGNVFLKYCPIIFDERDKPIGVEWKDFSEMDSQKIRLKQKELFEEEKKINLKKWKNIFSKRYQNSEIKQKYLFDEINHCNDLLFNKVDYQSEGWIYHYPQWNLGFEYVEIFEIQQYVEDILVKGKENKCDYIHSPNCPFKPKGKVQSQVFAQSVWEYYNWIKSFLPSHQEKNKKPLLEKTKKKSTKEKKPKSILILKDIWEEDCKGTKKQYDLTINFLLEEYLPIDSSFITEISGNYYWNKVPQHGWVQYLAGFMYICIKQKWILNRYSAPKLKDILCRTFNIDEFDSKPFRSLFVSPPDNKYLKPFSLFPENE